MTARWNLQTIGLSLRTDLNEQFPLDPAKTALVVVDMQYYSGCRTTGLGKRYADAGQEELVEWRFDRIEQIAVPNIQRLLAHCRANGVRVAYVQLGSHTPDFSEVPAHMRTLLAAGNGWFGNPNAAILEEIAPEEGEPVFRKNTVGAFASTAIDAHLRQNGIEHLVFTGISTAACVDSTARAAADLGYHCALVADGCSDMTRENHEWALHHFQRLFGRVMDTDDVLKELSTAGEEG
jgi:nicotinamidase-related amidase